jgi:hypothetical protein
VLAPRLSYESHADDQAATTDLVDAGVAGYRAAEAEFVVRWGERRLQLVEFVDPLMTRP